MKKAIFSKKFIILLVLIIVINSILSCGCWNYKDIENSLLVTGFAIDKSEREGKYLVTVEVLDFEMSGKEAKQTTKFIELKGKTIFDAIRNAINLGGKKLYWPHANIAIISEQIAREGITPIIDFIYRDSEIRSELNLVISKENTAREVLMQDMLISQTSSDCIHNMIHGQKIAGKFHNIMTYQLLSYIVSVDGILPAIELKENLGKKTAQLTSTAIFKSDKLVGYFDEEESQAQLLILDKIMGGVITINEDNSTTSEIALEIFKSKTKVKPRYIDNKLTIDIDVKIEAAIAENATNENYMSGKNFLKLKEDAEKKVKESIENVIKKSQLEYNADVVGFALEVQRDLPKLWRQVENNWDYTFKNIESNVNVSIQIINSGFTKKSITVK
ncbi:Ger(x)C family spore germination protein [Ruminiclostridium herbifermentans]|uniref:Ger(X)C family spore germination protein n=1 Tax=Ruminiclostridium herbifermentans TaxID=2488810 RepID=A0A4U7JJ86_9FIRM|nr:Ger(x)C family spore germination protein [Ruminiclostridium herbifermentans]QNU65972.1 Ger(x)C family spore germination protein [Ruminiclostridium herbifermentans]